MSSQVTYSIVIPVYNEEGNIEVLCQSLVELFKQIGGKYEIIFVDDGSADRSFEIIKEISGRDGAVRGMALSRNFGHQVALTAGLEQSLGDVVIMMDADMQHPPALISELIKKYQEGFDIVNTVRNTTKGEGFFKRVTSKVFYKLLNSLSDVPIEPASADFRLMSRRTVNAFLKLKEKDRFTRGLISWMGFKQTKIYYDAAARKSGESKYTFRKMFHFAVDG
ncbi:MAG: glycosyltransferase family 2 protein, partial [Bacteroidia bacterium]|nr:glycosyltransferase family 2 protein [Bacteroidia bacterium]